MTKKYRKKNHESVSAGGARGRDAGPSGRAAALAVLRRVMRGRAFLPELLEREFDARPLPAGERRLAAELAYGCVRRRGTLDGVIERCSGRKISRISRGLRDVLRIGIYQLLYCDRIPPYAAVNEAVEMAKRHGPPGSEKFVNAVMRAAPRRAAEMELPADRTHALAAEHSLPPWLVGRWIARWGGRGAEALCRAQNVAPPLTVRVNPLRGDRPGLIARLGREGAEARENAGHPLAVDITRLPSPLRELRSFREGLFQVQDVSGMRVSGLLGARSGERVIDLCAAPGGKATAVAEEMGDEGRVVCIDISGKRAVKIIENARRLGLRSIAVAVGDGRHAEGFIKGGRADRVLVDAPCSNTGVLARRPEARWRLRKGDIRRLADTQARLLRAAAELVRPGGVLVYATCSIEREENEGVTEDFLAAEPSFSLARQLSLLPHRDGCDGGYAAKFIRAEIKIMKETAKYAKNAKHLPT